MDFKKLTDQELFQAYQGYLKLEKTGEVGHDDFGGLFRQAIDESSASCHGTVLTACHDLMAEIAVRWYSEHSKYNDEAPRDWRGIGPVVWALSDDGKIKSGTVAFVDYNKTDVATYEVLFDNGATESFDGDSIGKNLFWTKEDAQTAQQMKSKLNQNCVYFYRSDDDDGDGSACKTLAKYNGQECLVLSDETEKVKGKEEVFERAINNGRIFLVRFLNPVKNDDYDGEYVVYGDELEPIENCVKSKLGFYYIPKKREKIGEK